MSTQTPSLLRGVTKLHEPMAAHTSWKIGGEADLLYIPSDIADLALFLSQQTKGTDITFIGLGSNILVRDKGIRGVVVLMKGGPAEIVLEQAKLIVDAGTSCAKLSRFASKNGLSGLEFLSGIPGTIGGAMAMNAGAFGNEIWTFIRSAVVVTAQGDLETRKKESFDIGYRTVSLENGCWFVQGVFDADLCRQTTQQQSIKHLLEKRKNSQPIGLPSCGSVFKNPKGDFAARLIEASGLKGHQIGKAQISAKHANFIINLGGALASDVEALIAHIQKVVLDKFGLELKTEVRFIGEAA
jgi:UDP-N-acetylmuramate dehydrogenase